MDRFFVVPRGMEGIVEYIKERYHNMPMFVTENGNLPFETIYMNWIPWCWSAWISSGYSSPGNEDDDFHHDFGRIRFHQSYLAYLARSIRSTKCYILLRYFLARWINMVHWLVRSVWSKFAGRAQTWEDTSYGAWWIILNGIMDMKSNSDCTVSTGKRWTGFPNSQQLGTQIS